MRLGTGLLIGLIGLLSVACGAQFAPSPSPTPDAITVQLKWVHQAQFAGFYVAQSEGYYAEENLDVTLLPGGANVDLFAGLQTGEVDFSVVGADTIIIQRMNDVPVVGIATLYRINPYVIVARKDSGIRTPLDFPGHTMSRLKDGYEFAQIAALFERVGVDMASVNMIDYQPNTLLTGEADIISAFVAGSLIPLQAELGEDALTIIWPGDYGVHFYSDTIAVTEEMIANHPDIVERFLKATLRGHKTAIENPALGVDATMPYAAIQDKALQTNMLQASIPLIHTGEDEIGWMKAEVWEGMYTTLLQQGILQTEMTWEDAYTTQFLQAVYRHNDS